MLLDALLLLVLIGLFALCAALVMFAEGIIFREEETGDQSRS